MTHGRINDTSLVAPEEDTHFFQRPCANLNKAKISSAHKVLLNSVLIFRIKNKFIYRYIAVSVPIAAVLAAVIVVGVS